MKTVENSFDKSYNELLSSYNKTRNVDKFSVIYTGGEHKDSTLGVSGYEYKSTGVLYLMIEKHLHMVENMDGQLV